MKKILIVLIWISTFIFAENQTTKEYYLLDKLVNTKAPNTDPVCKAYVDALNKYPLVEDFFQAPMQPLSSELGYPKWEEFDIYERKDIYLRIRGGVADLVNG